MSDIRASHYGYRILVATLVICFMISMLPLGKDTYLQHIDKDLLIRLNLHRNRSLDALLKIITDSAGTIGILMPLVLLCVRRYRMEGVYSAIAYLVAIIASTVLKYMIHKPRPFITYPFIEKLSGGGSPSFPSGHTTSAFVTAAVLSIIFRRREVTVIALLWAGLVAYSRMALGVHYPSDVLAGATLGGMVAVSTIGIEKRIKVFR